jgi:hypothetical protein
MMWMGWAVFLIVCLGWMIYCMKEERREREKDEEAEIFGRGDEIFVREVLSERGRGEKRVMLK